MAEVNLHNVAGQEILIPLGTQALRGDLSLPVSAQGLILFAHGSGSSRFSSRNRLVAGMLNQAGLATLLFDLLTEAEERVDNATREYRFNIELLAERLASATDWAAQASQTAGLKTGYFGASTGAAAALIAAAQKPRQIAAVVSRGGRPDLAGHRALSEVQAPTLLLVGSLDEGVIELNRQAYKELRCEKEIKLVQGATHLFEEPGKLEIVAQAAQHWFSRHLT